MVVDESGSMSIIERQALVGINETLTTIQKMQKTHKDLEQRVTLITFDSTHKNLFYDNVSALFFQAEDGIRDAHVTGVQTCALPIYNREGGEQRPYTPRPRFNSGDRKSVV